MEVKSASNLTGLKRVRHLPQVPLIGESNCYLVILQSIFMLSSDNFYSLVYFCNIDISFNLIYTWPVGHNLKKSNDRKAMMEFHFYRRVSVGRSHECGRHTRDFRSRTCTQIMRHFLTSAAKISVYISVIPPYDPTLPQVLWF